jgi:hypothetical protein
MKRFLAVGGICGAVLLSGAMSAYAQDEHHEEAKQEEHHEQKVEEKRRIDDEHFRAHFGHDHRFAIRHVTTVGGRPHFAYSGYNFEIVDAWPAGWSYNDDCYIDFVDGGYFLFNLKHPGVRIAVTVL